MIEQVLKLSRVTEGNVSSSHVHCTQCGSIAINKKRCSVSSVESGNCFGTAGNLY